MRKFFSAVWQQHAMPLCIAAGILAGLLLAVDIGVTPEVGEGAKSPLQTQRPNSSDQQATGSKINAR